MQSSTHLMQKRLPPARQQYIAFFLLLAYAIFLLGLLLLLLLPAPILRAQAPQPALTGATIRFVATTGVDLENACADSANPCQSVQRAIEAAEASDEIHVAAGLYSGTMSAYLPELGDITATVIITKDIGALLGGFASDFSQRDPTVIESTLEAGSHGWVIFVGNAEPLVIDGFTITGATGTQREDGGAIRIASGAPTLSNNRISGNRSARWGAGIFVSGGAPSIVANRIFSNTTAEHGGGIYVFTGTVVITGNELVGNVASAGDGGGIHVLSGTVLIANNIIAQNQAISMPVGRGGGIMIRAGSQATIRDNVLWGNQSADGGSAIESNSSGMIERNRVYHNQVLVAGSALLIERTTTPVTLTNNLIFKNAGSGVAVRDFDTVAMINNTIHGNTQVSFGGPGNGIDVNAKLTPNHPFTATIINNLITGNAQCGIEAYNGVTVQSDFNNLYGNGNNYCNLAFPPSGANNLNVDPYYLDVAADNYRPTSNAPVVDVANANVAPVIDLFGDARPYRNGSDIGAIEAGPSFVYLPSIQR